MATHGPAVLVHGVPETTAVWDLLLAELDREDVVRLSPPGFGAPLPADGEPTMSFYRDWLLRRLAEFAQPVDLVGHDWGGGHVLNAVAARPDLVRSWVTDAAGVFDPDYVWHSRAQVWQTPEEGERAVDAMTGATLTARTEVMHQLGIPSPVAERLAAGQDQDMGRAILGLYRSARQPVLVEAGDQLAAAAARPGLVLSATEDLNTGSPGMRARVAARTGAVVATLDGLGHWWMAKDPSRGAAVLTDFWARL